MLTYITYTNWYSGFRIREVFIKPSRARIRVSLLHSRGFHDAAIEP